MIDMGVIGRWGAKVGRKVSLLRAKATLMRGSYKGDSINIAEAINRIDGVDGELTGSEKETLGRLLRALAERASYRETEQLHGGRDPDRFYRKKYRENLGSMGARLKHKIG